MPELWDGYDNNPYYSPEKCGLKIVGEIDDVEANYSFDMIVVWQEIETGNIWVGHDEGCSCPSPFEDVRSLSDFTRVSKLDDLKAFVEINESSYWQKWPYSERQELYRKVRNLIKGQQSV